MGDEDNQDLAAMKKLLSSWQVGILYELFKEEDIAIPELKMMQYSHLNALLKDYKMGVRIRFEHHFKSWRNKIGIPLKSVETNHGMSCCSCKANIENSFIEKDEIKNTTTSANVCPTNGNRSKRRRVNHQSVEDTDQIELDENQAPLSPQSVNSNTSLVNMLTSNEIVNFMPVPVLGSPNEKTRNTDDEAEMENIPLNTLSDLLSDAVYETPPKFPSKSTPEKFTDSLKMILQLSGSRGMSILKFFKEKNRLTNVHRSQLIQIIVDFFVENDYHLSLNASHNLEWEILKMFPTEKLEYYRTEKRGKIYVKFSNMKRYKRERSNKAKTEIESLSSRQRRSQLISENIEINNLVQSQNKNADDENGDDWYLSAEPEVMVKEENLSENDRKSEQN